VSKQVRALQARKTKNVEAMRALSDKAANEERLMTAEEQAEFAALEDGVKELNAQIAREERLAAEEAQIGVLHIPGATQITGGEPRIKEDPKRGFSSFGEFCRAVKEEGPNLSNPKDERLRIGAATPTTVGNELSGADGGFLVPPDYSRAIQTYAFEQESLLPLTDNLDIAGNSMIFPKDETVPWGTDGVRAYWQAEATSGTQVKPKLSTTVLRLYKLMALVPVTDELIEDTNALEGYLPRKTGDSIRWKLNQAILFGTGAGQPLGAFATGNNAVVTVAKESGQATLTLLFRNIAKMIARLPSEGGSFGRSLWFINNDVLPAVMGLTNDSNGTAGTYPVYVPFGSTVGGVQVTEPYGRLFNRPVVVTQHCASFTNQGDVLLLDPYYVRSISKDMMETATSMHLYFDADATAFRTTCRVDAQPKIVNPIAPYNGSNNLSPFVQLGAR
jgi:HK97 family phage major capsid protein